MDGIVAALPVVSLGSVAGCSAAVRFCAAEDAVLALGAHGLTLDREEIDRAPYRGVKLKLCHTGKVSKISCPLSFGMGSQCVMER